MNLLNIAAKLFAQKVSGGESQDISAVSSALSTLLPSSGDELDLVALVGLMNKGGVSSLVRSFLGDGDNELFEPKQLLAVLGDSKVSDFSSTLGIDKTSAARALSSVLPDLIDRNSSGGALDEGLSASLASSVISQIFK